MKTKLTINANYKPTNLMGIRVYETLTIFLHPNDEWKGTNGMLLPRLHGEWKGNTIIKFAHKDLTVKEGIELIIHSSAIIDPNSNALPIITELENWKLSSANKTTVYYKEMDLLNNRGSAK